jgi:hypothetical protein
MEVGDEGEVDRGKNLSLVECVLNLLQLDDLLLLKDFEGVLVACAAVSDKQNSAEGAFTEGLEKFILFKLAVRCLEMRKITNEGIKLAECWGVRCTR